MFAALHIRETKKQCADKENKMSFSVVTVCESLLQNDMSVYRDKIQSSPRRYTSLDLEYKTHVWINLIREQEQVQYALGVMNVFKDAIARRVNVYS